MDRNTRKILNYISDMEKQAKQMSYVKDLKKEVEINGTGTHRYRIKKDQIKAEFYDRNCICTYPNFKRKYDRAYI